MAVVLLLAVLWGPACADDSPVTPTTSDADSTTSTGVDTQPPPLDTTSGVDTTETASASGSSDSGTTSDSTGSTSTGETEGTTGEPAVPGRTMSQLVSAGTRTASRSYTLVHTLGQPSPLQSTHVSPGHTLRGGLVGANGSPP